MVTSTRLLNDFKAALCLLPYATVLTFKPGYQPFPMHITDDVDLIIVYSDTNQVMGEELAKKHSTCDFKTRGLRGTGWIIAYCQHS